MVENIIERSLVIENFSYTPPLIDRSLIRFDSWKNRYLEANNIEIFGNQNNAVYFNSNYKNTSKIRINFKGKNNTVIIGSPIHDSCNLKLNVVFHANNSSLIISDMHPHQISLNINSFDDNQMIIWGRGSTSNGTTIVCQDSGRIIGIGDDCMFASGICLRNSDMHGIYDLSTKKRINKSGNIILQTHVWVGQDGLLLGDVKVGYGSIIGAQSLVKGTLDPCSIYAGSPAKLIRDNSSWERGTTSYLTNQTDQYLRECKLKFTQRNHLDDN